MATILSTEITASPGVSSKPAKQPAQNRTTSVTSTDLYQSISKQTANCYQADQQVKYLHLQAEIDVLLQQLQSMKQNK
ncbi:MAG: hypothetical protein Tsb0014_39520 [Pleurocapsa sp.]